MGVVTLPPATRRLDASDSELLLTRSGTLGEQMLQVVEYRLR
ncbi:MAG: hypothetical protein K0S86_1235 [Geminicoccaceae bacterium]|nr:hypothetical protein [Geminicoccaceae bacterium]